MSYRRALVPVVGLSLVLTACADSERAATDPADGDRPAPSTQISFSPPTDPVIVAAGDISCATSSTSSTTCNQLKTSDIITGINPDAVLLLGDNQYENGELTNYNAYYAPTWGRFKAKTRPSAGNHEYYTSGAKGYYDYFNGSGVTAGPAGDRSRGYYSYDIGGWHLIALNSNCSAIGGCGTGSAQEQWLRADLAANRVACVAAYWHHPRFSSGKHGSNSTYQALWQALYDYDADLVLNGHDHTYERFARQTPSGALDNTRGIREIVVGTGGKNFYSFPSIRANSEVRNNTTFGILRLTLRPAAFDWSFRPISGKTWTDTGTDACHGTPMRLQFTPAADARVSASAPSTNYGSGTTINADGSPDERSLIRFAVSGVGTRSIASVKLRVWAVDPSTSTGITLHRVTGSWSESSVTFGSFPAFNATPLATFPAITAGRFYEVDVTSAVTGDGTFDFAIRNSATDGADFTSREGAAWNAPMLIVNLR